MVFDAGLAILDTSLALTLEAGLMILAAVVDFDLGLDTLFLASPVRAFLAAPLLAVVFFLVEGDFLGTGDFFVATANFLTGTFLRALGFLAVVVTGLTVFTFVVVVRALGLGVVRAVPLATDFLEVALEESLLEAGIVFSLAVSEGVFGASLTLPEGPLGRRKIPFTLPEVIARLR